MKLNEEPLKLNKTPPWFHVRCPQCGKLYTLNPDQIRAALRAGASKETTAEFECKICHSSFSSTFPPKTHGVRIGKLLTYPVLKTLSDKDFLEHPKELKKCPKCNTVHPRLVKECVKCGIVFSKMEGLPIENKLGAKPSLVKMWQDLMQDYSNLKKHVEFVNRCEEFHALPFALKKYRDLKEVQPHDEMAQQMLQNVFLKDLTSKAHQVVEDYPSLKHFRDQFLGKIPWKKIFRTMPYFISALLIFSGLALAHLRNLAGFGASLLFLTLGFYYFNRKDQY